ncbi:MAG: ATP-binding protein [Methylococcaceae bacterium]
MNRLTAIKLRFTRLFRIRNLLTINYSLRHLLLISLLSASMLIWGIAAYISYRVTRDEVANLFDAELAQSAKVLHTFVEGLLHGSTLAEHWKKDATNITDEDYQAILALPLGDNNLLLYSEIKQHFPNANNANKKNNEPLWEAIDELWQADAFGHKYERKIAFQLWSKEDGLLLRSESAPDFALSSSAHGFSETHIENSLWHVFSITDATGGYVIHVGQKADIRSQLTDEISIQLVAQFLIGLPFLGLVIWLIVGHALKPINHLERALAKREASYLKPLSIKTLPAEIVPMVNEINNLFNQLEQAFEHERQFTADAAHELRTPLAGLLTQAQVALRTQDEETRQQALKRIEQAVNRMTYLVQQLLTFSRIESSQDFSKQTTSLSKELVQLITELEPDAYKKRIQLEFIEDNPVPLIVNAPLISVLMRNIIDNAIKYTPNNGMVNIKLINTGDYLQFCVEDSGPGIAPEEYENSLKRFHRCVETAHKAQGTGLGFSIVQRIAAIHEADLILGVSSLGGLKVTVLFPLPNKRVEMRKTVEKKTGFF